MRRTPSRAQAIGALLVALAIPGCASMNYTEDCRQLMNDCMRDCAERARATPDAIPLCTECKPQAERCDAQERLVDRQASAKSAK